MQVNIITSPEKMITMPDAEIKVLIFHLHFFLNYRNLQVCFNVNDLVLESDNTTIKLIVTDKKNATSNVFSRIVIEQINVSYSMNFKIENLKVLEGTIMKCMFLLKYPTSRIKM